MRPRANICSIYEMEKRTKIRGLQHIVGRHARLHIARVQGRLLWMDILAPFIVKHSTINASQDQSFLGIFQPQPHLNADREPFVKDGPQRTLGSAYVDRTPIGAVSDKETLGLSASSIVESKHLQQSTGVQRR